MAGNCGSLCEQRRTLDQQPPSEWGPQLHSPEDTLAVAL